MSKYSISYSNHSDETTKTCNVIWTIYGLNDIAEDLKYRAIKDINDLSTDEADCPDNADEDTKFRFKIKFFVHRFEYYFRARFEQIYYLAPIPALLKYSLQIKSRDIYTLPNYSMVEPNKWQFVALIHSRNQRNYMYQDDVLDLWFKFIIKKEIKMDPPKAELNGDLGNMLNNSIYSDVTIRSAQGVEFRTHKAVLAARSAVLKAHFEHNMVESQTNIINTSLETEVLQEVVTYIYTDNSPKIDEMPEKLLAAADYYQLSRLKHLCEEALFKKVTVENAIATLELADLYLATKLKKVTLAYIRDGHEELLKEIQSI